MQKRSTRFDNNNDDDRIIITTITATNTKFRINHPRYSSRHGFYSLNSHNNPIRILIYILQIRKQSQFNQARKKYYPSAKIIKNSTGTGVAQ